MTVNSEKHLSPSFARVTEKVTDGNPNSIVFCRHLANCASSEAFHTKSGFWCRTLTSSYYRGAQAIIFGASRCNADGVMLIPVFVQNILPSPMALTMAHVHEQTSNASSAVWSRAEQRKL